MGGRRFAALAHLFTTMPTPTSRTPRRGSSSPPARRWSTYNVGTPHPRYTQPLSHGATRRDSSPFRGAEGVGGACYPCATVYHDADTCVSHPPYGAASPTPLPLDDGRRGFVAERYVSPRRAHRPRCAVRQMTGDAGYTRPPHLRARPCVACLPRLTGCGRSA